MNLPPLKKAVSTVGIVFSLGLVGFTSLAQAAALDQLKAFLTEAHTAKGAFTQNLVTKPGRKPVQSSGEFSFSRPGKFRWSYEKPYRQLMVSDSNTLWAFDPELNQVTIKKMQQSLGASPAALLAGETLEKNFDLRNVGLVDGLETVDAVPKAQEAIFQRVRIGLSGKVPVTMEIYDNFGQVTYITFSRLEINPALPGNQFTFAVPKGADVVKE